MIDALLGDEQRKLIDCYTEKAEADDELMRFLEHDKAVKTFATLVASNVVSIVNPNHPQVSILLRRNDIGEILSADGCPVEFDKLTDIEVSSFREKLQDYIRMK